MIFIALFLNLALEQIRPLRRLGGVEHALRNFLLWVRRTLEGGDDADGVVAWMVVVALPILLLAIVQWFLRNSLLYILWTVAVLYATMGFRQFSSKVSEILGHLQAGRHEDAWRGMVEWTEGAGPSVEEVARPQLISAVLARALTKAQHHVFSPLLWVVLLGPIGPLLYRWSCFVAITWPRNGFGHFANRIVDVLEWLPARTTALGYAFMGNFYDAIHCWKTQAGQGPERSIGVLMASSAGALNVVLQNPTAEGPQGPLYGSGDDPDENTFQAAVALVWRTLVFLMVLIGLLSLLFWWGRLT